MMSNRNSASTSRATGASKTSKEPLSALSIDRFPRNDLLDFLLASRSTEKTSPLASSRCCPDGGASAFACTKHDVFDLDVV